MNSLSWFLYFADVLSGIQGALVIFSSIAIALLVGTSIYQSIELGKHFLWKWVAIPMTTILLAMLIPSKNTIYAIGASELGEKVYQSDTGQKIQKALSAWIDEQLDKKEKQ